MGQLHRAPGVGELRAVDHLGPFDELYERRGVPAVPVAAGPGEKARATLRLRVPELLVARLAPGGKRGRPRPPVRGPPRGMRAHRAPLEGAPERREGPAFAPGILGGQARLPAALGEHVLDERPPRAGRTDLGPPVEPRPEQGEL